MLDIKNILAAELYLNFDYNRIKEEILSTREFWNHSPPYDFNINAAKQGSIFASASMDIYDQADFQTSQHRHINKDLRGQYIFYMKYHKDNIKNINRFDVTKKLNVEGWQWRPEIIERTCYLKSCIESLPYDHIGCIRVFVTENTFFATHRDYGWGEEILSKDYDSCFGLSIIPDTGGVPMKIQSFETGTIHEISGNAMLFNDSAWHGVGMVNGIRITIRVFGKIDYQKFLPYINQDSIILE
jgi:hypothetical protein